MKPLLSLALICAITCSFTEICRAAVIQTPGLIQAEGALDGDGSMPGHVGDTLDYLKLEVLTTTSITVTSGFGGGLLLQLAQFIGRDDEFGFIGNPYRLEQTSSTEWSSLTRLFEPGIYVAIMGVADDTSYDVYDGFQAVNPEGGDLPSRITPTVSPGTCRRWNSGMGNWMALSKSHTSRSHPPLPFWLYGRFWQ